MTRKLALLIFIGLGAVACGGGGGDDSPAFVPTAPADDIGITLENGQQIARVAYLAAAQSGDSAGLVGNAGIAAAPTEVYKPTGEFAKPVQVAVNQIPFGPEIVPCDVDGEMEVSGNLDNPLTLSAGDTIRIEARECDDGQGEVIHGVINFTVNIVRGDITGGLYELTMALQIDNFQVTTADDVLLSNGRVTVTVDTLESPFVSTTVRGDALTVDSNSGSESLLDFLVEQTFDGGLVPSPYTMNASGTLDSSLLGGTVRYSTPTIFEGFDLEYPHTGELLVRGQDNTRVRLIAMEGGVVQILIYSSGGDTPDQEIETTWEELLG
jgi:hypothetical protein